jgi:tRNA (guanine10-N2)-dimethyltransferase|tara:strand:+ start:96 stop:1037 length:942 start_codon:yes stop_codon:yes gene_type:complete
MYLYKLSKQNLELSKEELLAVAKKKDYEHVENYLLIDELVDYEKLAYTKKTYKLLFTTSKKNLIKQLELFNFNNIYKESFRLKLVNNHVFEILDLADIIWADIEHLEHPIVNLRNARTKIDIIFSKKIFCCLLIHKQKESFERRKAHLRKYNHPTSLNPRLARCLVNLSDAKEILDPFCGAGGILLEALLIRIKTNGFDLDKIMIKKCRKNLKSFNLKCDLKQQNALKINKFYEAIVTDMPYGKNSKISDIEKTYKDFLKKSYSFTNKLIIVFPNFTKNKKIITNSKWKIKKHFSYYLHKSLSKEIFVLGKNS